MTLLEEVPEGTIVPVKARAGGSRNQIGGFDAGALRVMVTQVAERGKANAAIAALLAKTLGCSRSSVELLTGAKSSQKKFLIHGLSADDVLARLKMPG